MALFDFDELEDQVKAASVGSSQGPRASAAPAPSAAPAAASRHPRGPGGGRALHPGPAPAPPTAAIAAARGPLGPGGGAAGVAGPGLNGWDVAPGPRHAPPDNLRAKAAPVATRPGSFVALLKRYDSAEVERVPAHRELTVEALQDVVVSKYGFDSTVKLVGGSSGARDRYQQKQKGWALEGHASLDSSHTLGSLTCSALLVYQRRVGPVAELDLSDMRDMARRAEEERQARDAAETAKRAEVDRWRREAQEAAVRARAERARAEEEEWTRAEAQRAREDEIHQEASAAAAAQAEPQPPGGGEEAELLAQALEVEMEVERRLQLGGREAGRGRLGALMEVLPPARGSAWSQPDPVFFVDAMNDVLSLTRRVVDASTRYSTKVLEEVAEYFATLCFLLNLFVLCSFPADASRHFQGVFAAFTRPGTGISDLAAAWCDAVTLAKGRNPMRLHSFSKEAQALDAQSSAQAVANARREMHVTLRGLHRHLGALLDAAEHGERRDEATATFRYLEDILRRRSPSPAQLGPMRVTRTTPVTMTKLLYDLRRGFKEAAFQDSYRELPRGDARVLMALTVQRMALPKHGFSGDFKGVRNMRQEVSVHTAAGDHVVFKLMRDIHQLLDVADTYHEEVLTLDFGTASRVEQEASLFYQQDFTLTNLEKLVGARLAAACARGSACGLQGSPAVHAGFELFFARLCAAKVQQPLPAQSFAVLASTAREVYAAMGGPRRRLALNMVHEAVGCRATRRALAIAEVLRLGEEPMVASKRHALETLDAQVLQCFQNQPEVNASVLASSWQRGELDFEDTEAGGEAALHLAAGDGNLDLVRALLLLGARVDRRDRLGRTPAHWAAACGHAAVLAALADRGADLNAADTHGRTPRGFMGSTSIPRRPVAVPPRWCD